MKRLDLSKIIAEMERLRDYMGFPEIVFNWTARLAIAYNRLYLQQYSQYRHMWE